MTPDLSLLLATYRRPALLARTLAALADLETPGGAWELLVVDNADDAAGRGIAGVPRFLIRSVAVQAGRYGSALLAGDRTRRLDAAISFHKTLGRLYQHVVTARRR